MTRRRENEIRPGKRNWEKTVLALGLAAVFLVFGACGRQEEPGNSLSGREQSYERMPEPASGRNSGASQESGQKADAVLYGLPEGERPKAEGFRGDMVREGDWAPSFTADLYGGGAFSTDDCAGKVLVLNFWSTWCGPCVREMPAFEWLKEDYGDTIGIVAVAYADSESKINAFVSEAGYTFPIAYDPDSAIAAAYQLQGVPTTYIIDGNGVVQFYFLGADTAERQYREYMDAIETVLNNQ